MRFTKLELLLAVVLLAAAYGCVCLYLYAQRPLFANEFGYWNYGIRLFPNWGRNIGRSRSDLRDSRGFRYLADFTNNVFIVIEVPTKEAPAVVRWGPKKAEFALLNGETLTLECSPGLHVVGTDRVVSWKPLAGGGAEQLFRAIEQRILVEELELDLAARRNGDGGGFRKVTLPTQE